MKKRIAALVAFCLFMIPIVTIPVFADGEDNTVLNITATADMTIGNNIKSTMPIANSELITVKEYKWYKYNGTHPAQDLGDEIEDGEKFAENTNYVLTAVFTVPDGYTIDWGMYKIDDTVNGVRSSYCQISDDRRTLTAYYILKTAEITSNFQVSVQEPVIGDAPSAPTIKSDPWTELPYTIDSYKWFYESEYGNKIEMAEDQKFETGIKYTLSVALNTDSTKCLVADEAGGTLNSKVKSNQSKKTSDTHIELDFDLGEISILRVQNANITIKEPVTGETFDYTPTITTNPVDSTNYEIIWYEYDPIENDYTKITDNTQKAEADKYYIFDITLTAKDGYAIDDTLVESVNGELADTDYDWWLEDNDDNSVTISREYTTYSVAYEIPFSVKVEQGGSVAPTENHTFEFLIDVEDYYVFVPKAEASITTNGLGTFEGTIKLYGNSEWIADMLDNAGIWISEKSGGEEEWTYSDTEFFACREENDEGTSELCYYVINYVEDSDYPGYSYKKKSERTDKIEFVNIYTSDEKTDSGETPSVTPDNSSTDDDSLVITDNGSTDASPSNALSSDEKAVNGNNEKIQNPKTADETPYIAWATMLVVSAVVLISIITRKKRNSFKR
jgi:hypothetical protein